jgi:hypothetical protein
MQRGKSRVEDVNVRHLTHDPSLPREIGADWLVHSEVGLRRGRLSLFLCDIFVFRVDVTQIGAKTQRREDAKRERAM